MSQPVKRVDLRAEMPETARWVDAKRLEWGPAHVNDCIKRALTGVPGLFYAMEKGKVLGTPFPATDVRAQYQSIAIVTGCTFAGFVAEPAEGVRND